MADIIDKLKVGARKGNVKSQCKIADSYLSLETRAGKKLAVKWLRLAAENGNAWSQYNLGLSYQNGEGVPRDIRSAASWYKAASDQGYDSAQQWHERLP